MDESTAGPRVASVGDGSTSQHVRFEIVSSRLEAQLRTVESLDRKLTATFTLDAAVVALFAAVSLSQNAVVPLAAWSLLAATVFVFTVKLLVALVSYSPRRWQVMPNLQELQAHAETGKYGAQAIRQWAADSMTNAYYENQEQLRHKGRAVRITLALSAIQLILIGVSALIVSFQ